MALEVVPEQKMAAARLERKMGQEKKRLQKPFLLRSICSPWLESWIHSDTSKYHLKLIDYSVCFILQLQFSNLVLRKASFQSSKVFHNGQISCKSSPVIVAHPERTLQDKGPQFSSISRASITKSGCSATIPLEHELPILQKEYSDRRIEE